MEDEGIIMPISSGSNNSYNRPPQNYFPYNQQNQAPQLYPNFFAPPPPTTVMNYIGMTANPSTSGNQHNQQLKSHDQSSANPFTDASIFFSKEVRHTKLSQLSVDGVVSLLHQIDDLKPALEKVAPILHENAISGRVLRHCDLNELKTVLGLSFGHWELFRLLIQTLRDYETQKQLGHGGESMDAGEPHTQMLSVPQNPVRKLSQSNIEKQVSKIMFKIHIYLIFTCEEK